MNNFKQLGPLIFTGNVAENYCKFKQKFKLYMLELGERIASLGTILHPTSKCNVSVERHILFTREQKEGELIDSYMTELRKLS
ncbi:hypothetical protein PR048_029821 [Dryococelus australis]|uniref:Uncharacterized protein n=1 Tax=Dryococelus australis TaxID=614101 RepID=A0ABQ9G783_9NEOP|nr:hypothetical protein PR048_029821 [Dryococelus australis]